MKFQLTFKTPDVLDQVDLICNDENVDEIHKTARKFVKYDEYITVEFDTEAGTATVVKV